MESTYDYIIIDTENDEGILTQNAIIVSDLVIGISEPGKDSFVALHCLRSFVDDLNHDFDEQTQVVCVANKIDTRENDSNELLEELSLLPEYLGYLPRRTILMNEKSIFSLRIDSKNKAVIDHVETLFDQIKAKVDQLEEVA